jgi:hypothetical protein
LKIQTDKPKYLKNPIGYVDSLTKYLSVNKDNLVRIADEADSFYYLHDTIEKADGSFREIYAVKPRLKNLQKKIKNIYSNVHFPPYLKGSIKGTNHFAAAKVHVTAKLRVNMDISNFFPSLKADVIFDIWKRFFNFPPSVAELLTKLTTFNGFLPQGAPTSPGLANLAFWDIEPIVVDTLQENGFKYTRYVDDVIVSSKEVTEMHDLAPIFESIFGMFRNKGVKPNRNKIDISTSGHAMLVHNLNINSGVPTITQAERNRIRAAIHECKIKYLEDNQSEEYKKLWNSTFGRIIYLNQLHKSSQVQRYLERLQAVRPVIFDNRLTSPE